MEYFDLIQKRYSVRAYRPDPVEDAKLTKVLDAARLAPTGANRQPFQLIVAHVKGREAELQRVYHRQWFVQAPLSGNCATQAAAFCGSFWTQRSTMPTTASSCARPGATVFTARVAAATGSLSPQIVATLASTRARNAASGSCFAHSVAV